MCVYLLVYLCLVLLKDLITVVFLLGIVDFIIYKLKANTIAHQLHIHIATKKGQNHHRQQQKY